MTTTTSTAHATEPATVPTSLVEVHKLADVLLRTLAALDFTASSVTTSHHLFAWGHSARINLMVDDAEGVARFLGGLTRVDFEVDGQARHYFTGQWRGALLHVSPDARA